MMTIRQFLTQSYRLISAQSPTVPLHGNDLELMLTVLNELMQYYAATGLMLTVAKTVTAPINLGIKSVYFAPRSYPTETTQTEIVTLSIGSPSFTVVNGGLYAVGDSVTGLGIPAGSVILEISGNVITLTEEATIAGVSNLTFTHDISDPSVVYIKEGRLANLDSAWLLLDGVTYPLIIESRDTFLASWKYEPLQGLPRFAITFPEVDLVNLQLYPAPSQFFEFFARGKFQLSDFTANDTLSALPDYFRRFLLFAIARDTAMYKGRADAWTDKLEALYQEARDIMEAASEVNLTITGDRDDLLNGAWRVRAGI